jgi:cation:H+ antiporter
VGTDIPEIVNSVVAAHAGHGDITLGDTIGSVFTQITFGLGLLPFMAASAIIVERRNLLMLTTLTVAGVAAGAMLYRDGTVSRMDALALMAYWALATTAIWRFRIHAPPIRIDAGRPKRPVAIHLFVALLALAVVGGASSVLVGAITAISATFSVPEYVLSFFGAAVATSLPEIAVELTAIRRGQRDIAMGDVLGSCLVDASLALAIGPSLFPTTITPALAFRGAIVAATGVLVAGLAIGLRGRLDRWSGALLLVGYVAAYFFIR